MTQIMLSDTFGILGYELMYFNSDTVEVVDPTITIAYTSRQEQYKVVNDTVLTTSASYNAYNKRGKLVATMASTGSGGKDDMVTIGGQQVKNPDPLTFQMAFYVWSYDYYSGFQENTITPPQLGIFKDAFGFEDTLIAEYSVKYAASSNYLGQPVYELTNLDVKMHHYDSFGRRYEDQNAFLAGGQRSAGFWISKYTVDDLFATLVSMDISYASSGSSITPLVLRNMATVYIKLHQCIYYFLEKYSITFSGGDISQSSHKTGKTRYSNKSKNGNLPDFQQMETVYNIVYQPLDRLQRVGSFEHGNYQKIPLGSTPAECACRTLGLTFNNIYAIAGATDIGVVQMLSALEQDLSFVFNTEQPSANYNDLTSLHSAIIGFSYPRASYIAKLLGLTYHWVPYVSAVVDALDFDPAEPFSAGSTLLATSQYPYIGEIASRMDAALEYVVTNFVIIDFGINDTVENVVNVYNLYKSYKFQRFYSFQGGENVIKLNLQGAALSNLQEWHRYFTKLIFAEKLDAAYNGLMQRLHAISGRVNLLDMRKLPLSVGAYAQFEVMENYTNTEPLPATCMISDVNITLDTFGKFDATISFIGKSTRSR